jgi:molecular chaperone GrpE
VPKKKKENDIQEETVAAEAVETLEGAEVTQEGAPAGPTPEEEVARARAEAGKNWDLYLRAQADLENYRKRAQREKEDLARFANEGILREILPVMDNLERAVEHAGAEKEGNGGLVQGVEMTLTQFRKVLEKFGVVAIPALGEPFDPARHEAVGQVETDKFPPNAVAQELQRGYLLNDRLLRPSMVMVARAPQAG